MSRRSLLRIVARASLVLLVALPLAGCGAAQPQMTATEQEKLEVNQRIAGVWRLTSYVPDQELSVALLMSMQSDRIMVRFEDNRIKSATLLMNFDRGYRIDSVSDNGFKLFIIDDDGVQYEVWAKFDDSGSLLFNARTEPWTGTGKLDREGAALVVR